ncbi:cytochrome P450 2J4-like [Glandiceps talaboti]
MKEAFNLDVFNDRPMRPSEFTIRGDGVVFCGPPHWKHRRRIVSKILRDSLGFGKMTIEEKILEEAKYLIKEIENEGGKPFDPRNYLSKAVSNIICAIVMGERFQYADPSFQRIISILHESTQSTLLMLSIFCRSLIYTPFFRSRFRQTYDDLQRIIMASVSQHKEDFDPSKPRDMIDMFLKDLRPIGEDDFVQSVIDLFAAGTETSSTALIWSIQLLVLHPEIQDKVQFELDRVIGQHRSPSMEDIAELPYIEAVISEIQRFSAIAPLAVPHVVCKDIIFHGYFIPKDTLVLANLWDVLHDPALWPEPDVFKPERFLNKNGTFEKPDEYIPFGIGSRMCLGEQLTKAELFLFFSSLFQAYRFEVSVEHGVPSEEPILGVTLAPAPYHIRAIKRTIILE